MLRTRVSAPQPRPVAIHNAIAQQTGYAYYIPSPTSYLLLHPKRTRFRPASQVMMYFGVDERYPNAYVAKVVPATTPPPQPPHDSARGRETSDPNPPPAPASRGGGRPSVISSTGSHENVALQAPNSTLMGRWELQGEWEMFIPATHLRLRRPGAALSSSGPSNHPTQNREDKVTTPPVGLPIITLTSPPPPPASYSRATLHCATQRQSSELDHSGRLAPVAQHRSPAYLEDSSRRGHAVCGGGTQGEKKRLPGAHVREGGTGRKGRRRNQSNGHQNRNIWRTVFSSFGCSHKI